MAALLTLAEFKALSPMPAEDIDRLVRVRWLRQSADGAAADITKETRIGEIDETGTAALVLLTPAAPLVASDANYATVSVYKRTAGGARVLVASLTTRTTGAGGSGDWAKDIGLALTIALATITSGDVLTGEVTKTGAGVVVPALALEVRPTVTKVDRFITSRTSWILARLRKRYDTAKILTTPPDVVLGWLEALVSLDCYLKRGFAPVDENKLLADRSDQAKIEIKEAADAKDGLFDLPLTDSPDASAISKGAPLAYSESSPYVWADEQARRGRAEDANGTGTRS